MEETRGSYFNLDETLRQAKEKFAALNPAQMAANTGSSYNPQNSTIALKFIDQLYQVNHPEAKITDGEGAEAAVYPSIIILHYLVNAGGAPLTGRWVAFRHLPGGNIYVAPFQGRAVTPFLKAFGHSPEAFVKAAEALGGRKLEQSGVSMAIDVFARVPLCFTLWPGDDELPATAAILFDEAAAGYLPTEDYAHLPALVIGALLNKLKGAC